MRKIATVVILVALASLPLWAQEGKKKTTIHNEQAASLAKGLAQFELKAKVDIPATDGIFVEDGKLVAAIYRSLLKDNPIALEAGESTKVSQVKVLDAGIQIFVASDSCALIGVIAGQVETHKLTAEELLATAKKSLEALFELIPLKPARRES